MFVSRQNQKLCKLMHEMLQRILFEDLNDPIFRRVGINCLKINSKKTLATVYLDIENVPKGSNVVEKLQLLNTFFRKKLGEEFTAFRIPHLRFIDDQVFVQALRIEKLIDEVKND